MKRVTSYLLDHRGTGAVLAVLLAAVSVLGLSVLLSGGAL